MTLILHTQLESLYRYDVSPITIRYNDLFPLFRCLMMFNYFTRREGGKEPDFSLFNELSDPARLKPISTEDE